jgi:endonuclease III
MISGSKPRANREIIMADDRLLAAAELLQQHYGNLDLDTYRDGWRGLVQFVLERQLSRAKFAKAWREIETSWILSAEDVARSTRAELLEFLQPLGGQAATVALMHRLSLWWQVQAARRESPFDASSYELEAAWMELSQHDRTLMTRVFCTLGGLQKFPLTRPGWRVACRHRWLSWYDESDEIPEFFEQGLRDGPVDLGQFAEWLILVGDDFCGPKPKCATCPLAPLLGPEGICEPEE